MLIGDDFAFTSSLDTLKNREKDGKFWTRKNFCLDKYIEKGKNTLV